MIEQVNSLNCHGCSIW